MWSEIPSLWTDPQDTAGLGLARSRKLSETWDSAHINSNSRRFPPHARKSEQALVLMFPKGQKLYKGSWDYPKPWSLGLLPHFGGRFIALQQRALASKTAVPFLAEMNWRFSHWNDVAVVNSCWRRLAFANSGAKSVSKSPTTWSISCEIRKEFDRIYVGCADIW